MITVSLRHIPRLSFSPAGQSLPSEIPSIETPGLVIDDEKTASSEIVIREHVLEFLLTMHRSEEEDNPVPKSVSKLLLYIVDRYMDHKQDMVIELEIELVLVKLELDKGD